MAFSPKLFAKFGKRNVLIVSAIIGVVGGIIGYVGAKQLNAGLVFLSTALHGASLAPYVTAMGGLLIALGALQKKAIAQAESGEKPAPKPFGCYPPGIALGSTWNPEVIEECGSQLAKEMAYYGIDMILGPNVNIHRDPLCGCLGESFTEDPYLMSQHEALRHRKWW